MLQVIDVIFGALLGAVLGIVLPVIISQVRLRSRKRKKGQRDKALNNKDLIKWLREYHDFHWATNNIPNELPYCKIGDYRFCYRTNCG